MKVSWNTEWWIIRRLALNIPSVVSFLSQRKCTAKVNSLKYNVTRDAFHWSIYSCSSGKQTYTGRKWTDERLVKYITSNFKKKKSFLFEAESLNYSKISSKDSDIICRNWIIVHVRPRSEVCQVLLWKLASQWQSHIFSSASLWFKMTSAWSSASEIYIII